MKLLVVKIPTELDEQLRQRKAQRDVPTSVFVRRVLVAALAAEQQKGNDGTTAQV